MLTLALATMLWIVTLYKALCEVFFAIPPVHFVFDILYYITVLPFSICVAMQLSLVRKWKARAEKCFMLITATASVPTAQAAVGLRSVWLCPSKIKRIEEVLDARIFQSRVTIKELASQTAINRTYLSRYFNSQMGTSYLNYFESRRLEKIIEELEKSEKPITVIYEEAGFAASTFYSTFKAHFGTTPGQWRKKHRESLRAEKQSDSRNK